MPCDTVCRVACVVMRAHPCMHSFRPPRAQEGLCTLSRGTASISNARGEGVGRVGVGPGRSKRSLNPPTAPT